MEISDVRKQVLATIERAKRAAADHRALADEASREFAPFMEGVAVPLFRQVANALRAHSYAFTVFTPGDSVRLMSDKNGDDYIELSLDVSAERPGVVGHVSRRRGSRVIESERPIGSGAVRDLTEQDVLDFVMAELTPFVER
jgi:hypothetical protein